MKNDKKSSSLKNSGIFRNKKKSKSKPKLKRTLLVIIASATAFALSVFVIPRLVNRMTSHKTEGYQFLDSLSFGKNAIFGIDVSVHQGKIDWSKISTFQDRPISFVYIKASEGATRKDRCYDYNIDEARKTGILVGSYHFFKANREPQLQFDNFTKTVDKSKQDLVPMIDIEEIRGASESLFKQRLAEFIKLIEEHYGKKPVIYSQNSFFNRYLMGEYSKYPLMIARYHTQVPKLNENIDWDIWQFTEEGKIEGMKGYVDINILNKEKTDLEDLKL